MKRAMAGAARRQDETRFVTGAVLEALRGVQQRRRAMNRRQLLRSVAGGLAGILASRRAPARAQTTRLHLLFRVDFMPQGEAELKRQLAEYGKQMKMEVAL